MTRLGRCRPRGAPGTSIAARSGRSCTRAENFWSREAVHLQWVTGRVRGSKWKLEEDLSKKERKKEFKYIRKN